MDGCIGTRVVLTPQLGVQALPSKVFGLIPIVQVDLVLGKSSTAFKVLRMIPGIVNSNYTGEI